MKRAFRTVAGLVVLYIVGHVLREHDKQEPLYGCFKKGNTCVRVYIHGVIQIHDCFGYILAYQKVEQADKTTYFMQVEYGHAVREVEVSVQGKWLVYEGESYRKC